MALETLKGVEEIGGFKVAEYDVKERRVADVDEHVVIDHRQNVIAFQIQNGPIVENGVNGCQVDTLIDAARVILDGLNKKFPCPENKNAIRSLQTALEWLEARKKNRQARGVEGYSKA